MSNTNQDSLQIVWDDVREPNWDGYDARAVSREALCNTRVIVKSLPCDIPVPSIGAEPDGHLTLEWHRSARCTLSVSVGRDLELHYAALLGPNRVVGTDSFADEMPARILDLIRLVYAQ